MSRSRIVYQNWIVEMGYDPDQTSSERLPVSSLNIKLLDKLLECGSGMEVISSDKKGQRCLNEIRTAVRNALDKLKEEEKEFIIHFYFMGQAYIDISARTGRSIYKLAALHQRALRKLKRLLASFVKQRFQIDFETDRNCPICRSADLSEIDYLISNRDKSRTWKAVIGVLKKKYGINIRTPQTLVGHEKYHGSNNIKH